MPKLRKYILVSAVTIVAVLLFVAAILPIIVRNKAVAALEESTGRQVRLDSVRINPLTLTVSLKGFSVADPSGPPLVAFRELKASLAVASIYRRALILSQVTLESPAFALVRTAPNRFNFSDILDRQGQKQEGGEEGGLLFSLNNISVKNGSVDFDDRGVKGGKRHTVRTLEVAIPFISNIPYLAENYVDPRVFAVVNGAPFRFEGKLKPMSKSLETSVHIGVKNLNLPHYLAYVPAKPAADLAAGTLDLDMDLGYRVSSDEKPELTLKGSAALKGARVDFPDGTPLLRIPSLKVKAGRLDVLAKSYLLESIWLDGLELFVERDVKGRWMYSRLFPGKEGAPQEAEEKTEDAGKTSLRIDALALRGATVHVSDRLPKGGFKTELSEISLQVDGFDTAPETAANYRLSLLLDRDASLKSGGTLALQPLAVTSSVELSGLQVGRAWPYLRQYLASPVAGKLGLSADLAYGVEGLQLKRGDLTLAGLAARYGTREGLNLASLRVKDASFSGKENRLVLGEVRLSRGDVSLSREKDGRLSLLSLFAERPAIKSAGGKGKGAAREGRPFSYSVKQFQLDGFDLSFTDKTLESPPRFKLGKANLYVANLQGPKFTPVQIRFSSAYGKRAQLKAAGTLLPSPFRYRGSLNIGRLPIGDFEPYFPDTLNFYVIGGYLDLALNLDLGLKGGKGAGSFGGSAGVRDFHSIDAVGEEDLLKWESLQLDRFQGTVEPFSLSIREVALNDVYSRVIIRKDGTLNLQELVKKEEAAPRPSVPAAAAVGSAEPVVPAAAPVKPPEKQRRIAVGSVTIQNGTLSFTDNHLPQTFNSTFYNLGGRVSGLSSEESKFADVDLRGTLENHSPMQITGRINPLRDDLFVDLKVSFKDIELSPVTPYSGTYLGYEIDKGKLYLDLKYLIERKRLSSENKVFIDQFTFGKKVESEKATNLPVRLAIALLQDRKGEIHLDLPVTGRTDDPQFSIWRLVGQVLKNVLVKAATSPFALLSSLAGGGDDFSSVQFEPGSARLSAAEDQKLERLAKMLADRPGLKLEINGFVDKGRDPEGYRQELLEKKLRNEKYLSMVKARQTVEGDGPEQVKVAAEEYPVFLKAVYRKEKFPKPRNALGLVKELPADEMRKLIVANTVVGDNELQTLARERAMAVINRLVAKGLPSERLFQGKDDMYKAPTREASGRSRVEMGAIAR